MKFTSVKKIIILALILALPGFLYYLLTSQVKNRYKPLHINSPKPLSGTFHKVHGKSIPDTAYHTIADFNLTDANGKPVSFKTFDKQIMLVNFFYTGCPTTCMQMNNAIDGLVVHYLKNPMVNFVSITVDPDKDTPVELKQYASKFTKSPTRWFLTGDTTNIYNFSRKGLLVDAMKLGPGNFVYADKVMLIDSEHHIRGYYSPLITD